MDSPLTNSLPTDARSIIDSLGAGATEEEKTIVRNVAARGTALAMQWPTATDAEKEDIQRLWDLEKSTLLNLGEARSQVVTDRLEQVLLTFVTAITGAGVNALLIKIPTIV